MANAFKCDECGKLIVGYPCSYISGKMVSIQLMETKDKRDICFDCFLIFVQSALDKERAAYNKLK